MDLNLIFYGAFAGITVFFGGVLANLFNHHMDNSPIKEEITHTIISFGAGIILSALALVLIPKGMEELDLIPMSISFLVGAFLFMYIDQYLAKKGGKTASFFAMLMDFLPETIALGSVFAIEPKTAALLAILIGLQNLPEAFNSFRELVQSGFTVRMTLLIFFILSFFGIIGVFIGHYFLKDYPKVTAHLMTYASGGILYLLIQDIIPDSKMDKKYYVSIGATVGFLIGIIGEKII